MQVQGNHSRLMPVVATLRDRRCTYMDVARSSTLFACGGGFFSWCSDSCRLILVRRSFIEPLSSCQRHTLMTTAQKTLSSKDLLNVFSQQKQIKHGTNDLHKCMHSWYTKNTFKIFHLSKHVSISTHFSHHKFIKHFFKDTTSK